MAGDLDVPGVQGSVYRVTGHIATAGQNSFAGRLPLGDAAGAFRGPGLLDPFGSRIHLIVRDHGLATDIDVASDRDPDTLSQGELIQALFNETSPRSCNVVCFDAQKSEHLPHR
ncbi:MAG TPA: hypothetical protein VGA16_03600 [Candidatus Limnocylindria bacterium]